MAAADKKITYTAAEVAELIRPLTQSVEALQKENAELKRKLEHMNGQSSIVVSVSAKLIFTTVFPSR